MMKALNRINRKIPYLDSDSSKTKRLVQVWSDFKSSIGNIEQSNIPSSEQYPITLLSS